MSTGRPSKHIYGAQTWGVAWRGHPAGYTSSSTTPALAAKIPRHGVVMGLTLMCVGVWWQHKQRRKELEADLPYLTRGNKALTAGAAMPATGVNAGGHGVIPRKAIRSEEALEDESRVTKAVTPLYPFGTEPGGIGPGADVDTSHFGLQVGFHNTTDRQVQITDLELLENPEMHAKGYSFQKMTETAMNDNPQDSMMRHMFHTPCAEYFADVRSCERKFGWRAHSGNRRTVHKHELPCSPELRKFHRCMDAMKERDRRLHQLRVRQSRGEQVGLKSDPAPGEARTLRTYPQLMEVAEADFTPNVKTFFMRHGRHRKPMYDYEEYKPDLPVPQYLDQMEEYNKKLEKMRAENPGWGKTTEPAELRDAPKSE